MKQVPRFEAAFRATPDVCAVLDAGGTIHAVNDAWSSSAAAGSATRTTGVGADYLGVCRRAADLGAPRALDAHDVLVSVLSGQRSSASTVYPCTLPSGVRWFRNDVFAIGHDGLIGARHVDVTSQLAPGAGAEVVGLVDDATRALSGAGLRLALEDLFDGPPHPAVLVMVTDDRTRFPIDAASGRGLMTQVRDSGADIDVLARLDDGVVAVVVTADDLGATMREAGTITTAVSHEPAASPRRWGIATRTAADNSTTMVARARQMLSEPVPPDDEPEPIDAAADRSHWLQRAATELVDAVTEYDSALDRGAPMTVLVELDRAVQHAERECVAVASSDPGSGAPAGRQARGRYRPR